MEPLEHAHNSINYVSDALCCTSMFGDGWPVQTYGDNWGKSVDGDFALYEESLRTVTERSKNGPLVVS